MFEDGQIIVVQILTAVALGAVIGVEREFGAQPAGLRTHMLVSLGAAIFALAGAGLAHTDPARIAAQVVTGVGFLGGGAIFREGVTVRGLTTAASLWVTAAVGVAVGLRFWWAAVVATALAITVLWLVKQAEWHYLPIRHTVVVRLSLEPDQPLDTTSQSVREALPRAKFLQIEYTGRTHVIELTTRLPANVSLPQLAESVRVIPGIAGVDISN
ncbi:MgtC/SapB family protein [Dactylosporangium sp. McL0621]|uniref:MgtC/SapB family protein n=1 Tax=Dactylosporangium sp. McL0621 TaxID=3415678 RepID=UPI003CF648B8